MSTDLFDQTLATITEFSFSDKLRLNSELATLLKKEGKTGAVGKAAKKSAKASDGDKPKRKAAPGTLAWMAFVKHCKTTMAERFEGCTKEPERLTICKAIRAEDSAAYDAFTKDFVDNYSDAEAEEVVAEPAAVPAPAAPVKAAKTPAKAAKATASATSAPAAPATPAKTTKAKTPGAPTKAAKAKTAPAAAPAMPQIEVDGETYFHDRSNNGLYNLMEDGSLGAWVGFYQPTDEEEPIRYTESPTDE